MNVQKAQLQKADYCPPPPDGDFYRIVDILDESERAILKRVRDFMDSEVAPIIEDYWVRDQFPFDLVPKIAALGIGGVGFNGYGSAGGSMLLNGFIAWSWRVSIPRSPLSGACTPALPLARSIFAATRSRSNAGCRQ